MSQELEKSEVGKNNDNDKEKKMSPLFQKKY
jgi:hypothetical protein